MEPEPTMHGAVMAGAVWPPAIPPPERLLPVPLTRREAGLVNKRRANSVTVVADYGGLACLHWWVGQFQGGPHTWGRMEVAEALIYGLGGLWSAWSAVRGWQLVREVKGGLRSND